MQHDALKEALGPLPFPSFWTLDELARPLNIEFARSGACEATMNSQLLRTRTMAYLDSGFNPLVTAQARKRR